MTIPSHRRQERRPVAGGVTHTVVDGVRPKVPLGGVKTDAPRSKAERLGAIVAAMKEINFASPGHVTGAGAPEVKALESILGWPPAARERDEAFGAFTKEREG